MHKKQNTFAILGPTVGISFATLLGYDIGCDNCAPRLKIPLGYGMWLVPAQCSTSRDLIAIANCYLNRRSQITSYVRQCEPSHKSSLCCLVVQEIGVPTI